jgi:hypothetical protein
VIRGVGGAAAASWAAVACLVTAGIGRATATPAAPEPPGLALPDTAARLVLGDGWQPVAGDGLVAGYRRADGSLLAITRSAVPNPDAWRAATRAAYAERIERGLAAAVPGYRRIAMRVVDAAGIPALDVEAQRSGEATLLVRVLLFRSYALALALEVPSGGDVAAARAIQTSFGPPPP